jgi:AraC-like DNA-binding protein
VDVERRETPEATWTVARRAPTPALRPYLLTQLEGWEHSSGTVGALREVPFPGVPLIFDLGAGWDVADPFEPGFSRRHAFVAGMHAAPSLVRAVSPAWKCIELRLTPLAAGRLLGLPMHELTNRAVELEDVLPEAPELLARLRETPSWGSRFDLLEDFLLRRLDSSVVPPPGLEWSWARLRRTGGRASIGALASELGWSHRRLIVRFREHIGLAPKTVARVLRFDRAAEALRSPEPASIAEVAFACGYFDQAHLTRDFRELAGTTPAAFVSSALDSGGTAA